MSDTPRTDALLETILDRAGQVGPRNCQEEWVALCRKLESELKDARQIASKYDDRYFATRELLFATRELLTVSTERAERLERELNEARTRIKELADIGGELADYLDLDDCECSDCQHLSRPVKDWQETVKRCLEGIE